jgi:hypothetical protein
VFEQASMHTSAICSRHGDTLVGSAAADLKPPDGGRQPKRQPTSDAAEKASNSCLEARMGGGERRSEERREKEGVKESLCISLACFSIVRECMIDVRA